jgi:hypothetical protein
MYFIFEAIHVTYKYTKIHHDGYTTVLTSDQQLQEMQKQERLGSRDCKDQSTI